MPQPITRRILGLLVALLVGASMLAAQPGPQDGGDQGDAPPVSDALVARLSLIRGSVSTQRADTGEWVAGALNTPLVTGDKVATGAGARAEVQVDYADMLRLGDNAQANLVGLNKNQIQIQLGSGLADYVVLKGAQASSEIDTPNIAIRPRGAAVIRILIPSESETVVIVRKGQADISTPQGSTTLQDGQQITVDGVDQPQYQVADAPPTDAWDRWNRDRDHSVESAASLRYANSYYTGIQDLDGYGYWTYVPGYGQVWVPNGENAGWSPYSNGYWSWQPFWGWTWVDYSPWGWAPYHYGRWFMFRARWVWWPGPVTPYYRPVWAPAYVSFFGFGGGGWGFGVGIGRVGWLPIGPCDPYRPWWDGRRTTRVNITQINVTNINYVNVQNGRIVPPLAAVGHGRAVYSNLAEVRTNERVRAGLVTVPGNQFGHGRIVAREHVTMNELNKGAVLGGTLPAVPTRASLGSTARVSAHALPQHVATRFYGGTHAVAEPTFSQERARVESHVGTTAGGGNAIQPGAVMEPRAGAQPHRFETGGTLSRAGATAGTGGRLEAGPRPMPARPAAPVHEAAPMPQPRQGAGPRTGWHTFGGGAGVESGATPREMPHASPRAPQQQQPQATPHVGASPRPGWQTFGRDEGAPRATSRPGTGGGGQVFRPQEQRGSMNGTGNESAPRMEAAPRSSPRFESAPRMEQAPRSAPRFESAPRPAQHYEARPALPMGHPIVSAPRPSGGGGESHPVVHNSGGGHPHP